MIDRDCFHYFLDPQVWQTKEGISPSQFKYACDLLRHFHIEDCKPTHSPFQSGVNLAATFTTLKVDTTLYHQLVGILLYLTHTHHDISFVVDLVAQYIQTPYENHWNLERSKKDTSVYLKYNSIWDTSHFKADSLVGWFH
jgi:hypothetical protein